MSTTSEVIYCWAVLEVDAFTDGKSLVLGVYPDSLL